MATIPRTTLVASGLGLLIAIYLMLNIRTLGWPFGIVDAPILLAQSILFSPLEYFTTPSAYDFLSYNNFTPLITLSWDVDYTLFGLHEPAFRMHQLISLGAMLILVYVLLLQTTGSVAIATLFSFAIMNLPATYATLDVMVYRHYIEGMIFALLSFLAFRQYNRSRTIYWLGLSVACYAVSVTAKEVYLPLPGLLFFMFTGGLSRRILFILPYAAALILYLAMRFYIIGNTGGYSGPMTALDAFTQLSTLLLSMKRLSAGLLAHPWASFAVLGCTLILAISAFFKESLNGKLSILMGVLGVLLPLTALIHMVAIGFTVSRWLFVPSVALMLYLAYLCSRSSSRALCGVTYLIVISISLYASYQRFISETPLFAKNQGKSYEAILESDGNSYLLFSTYSQLAAENYSVWVYIAKLTNGSWGTLPILHPGQKNYHDLSRRKVKPMSRKARNDSLQTLETHVQTGVVKSVHQDAATGLMTVDIEPTLQGSACIVYLFTPDNGIIFDASNCDNWRIPRRQLFHQLRKAGMNVEETKLAIWSDDKAHPWRSESYRLQELLNRS